MEFKHIPVLKNEVIEMLNINKDGIYVDGTLGLGGHSEAVLERLENGKLIGIDRDTNALEFSSNRLLKYDNKQFIHGNHDDIYKLIKEVNIDLVDGILLDLGVSSYQLDDEKRGFSYIRNNRLDMRMDTSEELTAYYVVNNYSLEKLIYIFKEYGEERHSKRIAENILKHRNIKKVETTLELVEIIKEIIPFSKDGHVAKRVFQAIRIEVNSELKRLYNTVVDAIKLLKDKGRLVIITFHSLEDRIVKNAMNDMLGKCTCPKDFPVCVCDRKCYGKVLTKKPILPTEEEIKINSRSKSAKVRVFERKM